MKIRKYSFGEIGNGKRDLFKNLEGLLSRISAAHQIEFAVQSNCRNPLPIAAIEAEILVFSILDMA